MDEWDSIFQDDSINDGIRLANFLKSKMQQKTRKKQVFGDIPKSRYSLKVRVEKRPIKKSINLLQNTETESSLIHKAVPASHQAQATLNQTAKVANDENTVAPNLQVFQENPNQDVLPQDVYTQGGVSQDVPILGETAEEACLNTDVVQNGNTFTVEKGHVQGHIILTPAKSPAVVMDKLNSPSTSNAGPLNLEISHKRRRLDKRSTKCRRGREDSSENESDYNEAPMNLIKRPVTRQLAVKKTSIARVLNKPTAVPINGTLFAKELRMMSQHEILDLRERKPLVFPLNGRRTSSSPQDSNNNVDDLPEDVQDQPLERAEVQEQTKAKSKPRKQKKKVEKIAKETQILSQGSEVRTRPKRACVLNPVITPAQMYVAEMVAAMFRRTRARSEIYWRKKAEEQRKKK